MLARGRILQLFPIDEYGKDAFDRLTVGGVGSFVEEPGEKGPQASTVRLLLPRRIHRSSHTAPGARVVR